VNTANRILPLTLVLGHSLFGCPAGASQHWVVQSTIIAFDVLTFQDQLPLSWPNHSHGFTCRSSPYYAEVEFPQ
jgi:hypothetical protein